MSKTATYGIFAVIIALGGLMLLAQHLFNRDSISGGIPGAPAVPAPMPKITEDKVRQHWKELIASAPPPRGPADAPYQVLEIGDFQCPSCGKLKPMLSAIMQASGGKAKLYFVNWPLTRIHPYALGAAEAGDAAAVQGKFWPVYDMLYANQDDLRPSLIQYDAEAVPGLNSAKFTADMNSGKYVPAIAKQSQLVTATGAISTPTFIVRSPDGQFTWYVGHAGTSGVKGLTALAKSPPWGGGLSDQEIDSLYSNSAS